MLTEEERIDWLNGARAALGLPVRSHQLLPKRPQRPVSARPVLRVAVLLLAATGCAGSSSRQPATMHPLCAVSPLIEQDCREGGLEDEDRDGWPNGLELVLGTDPNDADSDDDGRQDSDDPCPLLARDGTPPEVARVLQQVLDLVLAEAGPLGAVATGPEQPTTCFRGFDGPLLHRPIDDWELVALTFSGAGQIPIDPEAGDTVELEVRLHPRGVGCNARFRLRFDGERWSVQPLRPVLCACRGEPPWGGAPRAAST